MSHLPIWFLGSVPPEVCNQVRDELYAIPPREAEMGASGGQIAHGHRNTEVRFAPNDYWFSDTMENFAHESNRICKWEYGISGREAIQFAKYGPEQHYNWHVDNFPLCGMATDRKVTVICLLNDPSEFTGGELQVRLYSEYTAPLVKGSLIAFPSVLEHRVIPVLSGVRYSATMWFNGPRFR
jgi:PKHD-type hydroxylase